MGKDAKKEVKVNSRGLVPSDRHVQDRAFEMEYIAEMDGFLTIRNGRPWTEELRDEYNGILVKYGMIQASSLSDLFPDKKTD